MKRNNLEAAINWLALLGSICLLLMAASCATVKEVVKTETKIDSAAARQRDSLLFESIKKEAEYKKQLKEASKTSVLFKEAPPCPDVKIDSTCNRDSLVKIIKQLQAVNANQRNTIKMNADGSWQAAGQIAALYRHEDRIATEYTRLYNEHVDLKNVTDILATQYTLLQQKKSKMLKRRALWLYFGLFLFGLFAGLFLGNRVLK